MDEIQEQVEQYKGKYLSERVWDADIEKESHNDLDALLRKVVEECITNSCGNCKRGFPIKYIMATEEYRHSYYYCEASDIRHKFAWLLETKEE